LFWRGANFQEHQVALDVIFGADVEDFHDGHELVQLLADLFQGRIIAVNDKGHAGQVRLFGFADGEAVDVEAPGRQHSRYVRENPGLVLDRKSTRLNSSHDQISYAVFCLKKKKKKNKAQRY